MADGGEQVRRPRHRVYLDTAFSEGSAICGNEGMYPEVNMLYEFR